MSCPMLLLLLMAAPPVATPAPPKAPAAYEQGFAAEAPSGVRRTLEAGIAESLRKQRPGSMEDGPLAATAERLLEELSASPTAGTPDASALDFERVRVLLWREGVADAAFLPYRGRSRRKPGHKPR